MQRILIAVLFTYSLTSVADVRLPRLISDGMVLQRDARLKIWGWAEPNEAISISFITENKKAVADAKGNWSVLIGPFKEGGPFPMKISGSNTITINDILIGDVWLCSGQSNMELTMYRARDVYPDVIKNSRNYFIRQFLVPDKYDFNKTHDDLDEGSWVSVNPETIHDFTAVGYFFAVELNKKYGVPIGLINSALGGSPAQAWMSEDALKEFPRYYDEMQMYKDDDYIKRLEDDGRKRAADWYARMNEKDKGLAANWSNGKANDDGWYQSDGPSFADRVLGGRNGVVWYQREFELPESMVGKKARLWLGRIVDQDSAYVNGNFVGTTGYEWPPRKYDVDPAFLRKGKNTITVRVINVNGRGGLVPEKEYFLATADDTLDLSGIWKYQLGANMSTLIGTPPTRWRPGGLYNRMIAPLHNYYIKGVIWYQGESNAGYPADYTDVFSAMINNWREKWSIGDFPFLYVQLANYMASKPEPVESNWAELREAQLQTLEKVKNTAMAVTIDIGVWNDIHPLNKLDVGKRLALAAQRLAYNDKVVYSGPIYKSMKVSGATIEISFDHIGSGLAVSGPYLNGFAIAGADKKFVWAKAALKGNKVIVWREDVTKPMYVRYAWADNPSNANLYNQEGLPASPFRTDQ